MARPREHDSEEVRRLACRCFWENGYEKTSMADLREVTGVDGRQFLRDYGSKQGVFAQALRDFSEIAGENTLHHLEEGELGMEDIENTLAIVADCTYEESRLGCLICNTSQDKAAMADEETAGIVHQYFSRVESAYRKSLRRSSQLGEYGASSTEARLQAKALKATHLSMMMLKRCGESPSVLRHLGKTAVDSLR